jgi:hypothetical protein
MAYREIFLNGKDGKILNKRSPKDSGSPFV